MNDEDDDIDSVGLARARWGCVVDALIEALKNSVPEERARISLWMEIELGIREIATALRSTGSSATREQWEGVFRHYETECEDILPALTLRLERVLATMPGRWVAYVRDLGRSCFDPAELGAGVAIARSFLEEDPTNVGEELLRLLHWSWDCVLGQRPVPSIREFPARQYPRTGLEIIKAVEQVEVNWRALGLRPVINRDMALRWDEHERWTAWLRMVSAKSGEISPYAVLRLRSDGAWRIVRPTS
jgi:hypothetical protein